MSFTCRAKQLFLLSELISSSFLLGQVIEWWMDGWIDYAQFQLKCRTYTLLYCGGLEALNIPYNIKWDILCETKVAFYPPTGYCKLCTMEKYFIMFNPDDASLNLRSEFFSHCRHKERHLLRKWENCYVIMLSMWLLYGIEVMFCKLILYSSLSFDPTFPLKSDLVLRNKFVWICWSLINVYTLLFIYLFMINRKVDRQIKRQTERQSKV